METTDYVNFGNTLERFNFSQNLIYCQLVRIKIFSTPSEGTKLTASNTDICKVYMSINNKIDKISILFSIYKIGKPSKS